MWKPSHISGQGFWQDNQLKAQEYLYTHEYDSVENIIVGSSMAFQMKTDSLKNFCNLAFLGENYLKGLELIKEKDIYPKRVFIEINLPSKIANTGLFYDVLYNPLMHPLRKKFPAFRDGGQPFLIAASNLEHLVLNHTIEEQNRDKYSAIFQQLIEPTPGIGLFAGFENPADSIHLNESFDDLKIFIEDLKSHGTEIVFFEMPYYKTIQNSPQVISIYKQFRIAFPPDSYIYLPRPKYDEYQTLDGLHLGRQEAIEYTLQFRGYIDSLINIGK